MYYEINITKDGEHFFATAPRSITSPAKMRRVYDALDQRFLAKDGYRLTVTRYETLGKHIDIHAKEADN